MEGNQQQAWAAALQKARHHRGRQSSHPPDQQIDTLRERLAEEKARLMAMVQKKDAAGSEHHLKTLIRLRAELTAAMLLSYRETYGTVTRTVTERALTRYAHDCKQLLLAVESAFR